MVGHIPVVHAQGTFSIILLVCFLVVEVRWGRALSLPLPAKLWSQNTIFSFGLQKESVNLLVFSLLIWSNPCVFGRWSVGQNTCTLYFFHTLPDLFVCLLYVHSVTLFFPLHHLCVLISWSSCANQTGAKTNLPCHLHGIKPSISPVWLPKL